MKAIFAVKGLALSMALGAACAPAPAIAETVNCIEITSLPATIGDQGVYCLKRHMPVNLATGTAITVLVNNVTIDCNNFKIGNLAAGINTQARGVHADGRKNVIVRNCGIRGFLAGVDLVDGEYRVERNRLDNNTRIGIRVTGAGSVIRDNEIIDTGQSGLPGIHTFYGIHAEDDIDIIDNIVNGVAATGGDLVSRHVYGIHGTDMNAGAMRGNRVTGLAPNGLFGNRFGIVISDGFNNSVRDNTVVMGSGLVSGDRAIQCGGSLLGVIGGVASGNVVLEAGLLGTVGALLNCTSILGGNFVSV